MRAMKRRCVQMKIKVSELITQSFDDIKVTDIADFRSTNVMPKIVELQSYFDEYISSFSLKNNVLYLPIKTVPRSLLNSLSEQTKDHGTLYMDEDTQQSYGIETISVKYSEDYEYGVFDEYNLDADTIKSIDEYENIEECLGSRNECSYIESYSYSIYLEILLKK